MKRAFAILALLAVACMAGDFVVVHDAVQWLDIATLTTNGNSTVSTRTNVNGQVASLSIGITSTGGASVVVNIATEVDVGSSIGGSKVIYSGTLGADLYTNFWDTAEILYLDNVSITLTNASATGVTVKVMAITKP